ncbi:unnamed protein product [Leptidea sinapis]|uniref:Uncharacterized protein n=1 Tax=Leptidea sinapis TaxID=189913 RepID=A0A5E4QU97_9NEOP|nr:unnamed protein product [Leptidea sinapis]
MSPHSVSAAAARPVNRAAPVVCGLAASVSDSGSGTLSSPARSSGSTVSGERSESDCRRRSSSGRTPASIAYAEQFIAVCDESRHYHELLDSLATTTTLATTDSCDSHHSH